MNFWVDWNANIRFRYLDPFTLYTKKQYRVMVMNTVINSCPQGCARSRTKRPIISTYSPGKHAKRAMNTPLNSAFIQQNWGMQGYIYSSFSFFDPKHRL